MSNEKGAYVEIGTGFSFHPEPVEACREAVGKALKNIGRYDPSICFVFAAQRYATGEVPLTIRKLLGEIPILGCTTAGEILDGPKSGSLSLVLIASPFLKVLGAWGAEGANRDYKRALQAILSRGDFEDLLKDDHRREIRRSGKSIFGVMFTAGRTRGSDTKVYEIFTALKKATSYEIPFFGGCAGNAPGERDENSVFVGDKVIADGLAVAIFETSLRHGMGMVNGFVPQEQGLMVTRTDDHEILELNGRPVAEVLPSLLGVPLSRLTELSISALARKTMGIKTREEGYYVIPMTYLTDRGGLRVSQPVLEGTSIALLIPGPDMERVGEQAAAMALWRANVRHPALLFVFSCALVHVMMGEGFKELEFKRVKNLVGSCPVVGFYSFGEVGLARDGSNVVCHGALSCFALGNELTEAAITYLENRVLAERIEIQARQLRQALEEWEKTFDHAPFGIMVVDQDFVIRRMNRTLQNLLSFTTFANGGGGERRCYEIWECGSPSDECCKRRIMLTGEMVCKEFFEPRLNRWLAVTVVPLRDEGGSIAATIHFIEDVTVKKRFEDMRVLASKFEMATTIAGGIAHDFNNLLMVIAGNIELARRDIPAASSAHERLSIAEKAVFEAAGLVKRLLHSTMHLYPNLVECDLNTLLQEWLATVRAKLSCSVEFVSYRKEMKVIADPELLKKALANVLQNAEEAMKGKGNVRISLWDRHVSGDHPVLEAGLYAVIEVRDSGPGIKREYLARVFDPYFSTKPRGTQRGMGLGLAESLSIMSAMGGTVEISSTEGAGTSVYLYVPMAEGKGQDSRDR